MKNSFCLSPSSLIGSTLYRYLFILGIIGSINSCQCNKTADVGNPETTLSVVFEKLAYDRDNSRLVIVIKNTGNLMANNLSLQCTNISQDILSRNEIQLNTQLRKATLPLEELAPQAASKEIRVEVNYQQATTALIQIAVKSGGQLLATRTMEVNRYPIKLVPIGSTLAVKNKGETTYFKYKLVTEGKLDLSSYTLKIAKDSGQDIVVSIAGTTLALDASRDSQIITGEELKNLAQQKEILVKVTNNSPDFISIMSKLIGNKYDQIAKLEHFIFSDLQDAFLKAAELGELAIVQQAIDTFTTDKEVKINQTDSQGRAALHLAAMYGHSKVAELLLSNSAAVNQITTQSKRTPLYLAVLNNHTDIVEILIKHGVNLNEPNSNNGVTALHAAVESGHTEMVELLLQYQANPDLQNTNGWTPVKLAARKGDQKTVELLINKGADPNIPDKEGFTPLHNASAEGYLKIVQLLLPKIKNINQQESTNNATALHHAAFQGHQEIVQLLLTARADKTIVDTNGETAAEIAKTEAIKDFINNWKP